MTRIRLRVAYRHRTGVTGRPGQVIELEDTAATRLLTAGRAVAVGEPGQLEPLNRSHLRRDGAAARLPLMTPYSTRTYPSRATGTSSEGPAGGSDRGGSGDGGDVLPAPPATGRGVLRSPSR